VHLKENAVVRIFLKFPDTPRGGSDGLKTTDFGPFFAGIGHA
jgi:hypothetical protein